MTTKKIALLSGPAAAAVCFLALQLNGVSDPISYTLAITLLTAIWWATEAIPIPATSLIPFVLLPMTGVLSHTEAAAGLGSHVILLFMGGFMMAKGLEKANLHRRIALGILHKVGASGGKKLVFAFMISGAVLSMWISNTATALVLIPIAMAVVAQLNQPRLNTPIVLGIAFSCSLGGIATLIGTPPNLIFSAVYEEFAGQEYGFLKWFKVGLPVVIIGLPLMGLWLTRHVKASAPVDLPDAGAWTTPEKRVSRVFLLIIFLWIFRLEPFGGWSGLLGLENTGDSTVALLGVALMFLIPSGNKDHKGLLDWKTASDIPWGVLIMFASGITIAKAFQESGTADMVGQYLTASGSMHPFLLLLVICLTVTFLTEFFSNTASATLLMPVLAAAAGSASLPIELMMIPAAMSASCAFMLPVATPPNAISYGSGYVTIRQMMREGFVLNILMAFIISGVCYLFLT